MDAALGKEYFQRCNSSLGYNYGSTYQSGLLILDNKIALTSKQKEQTQEIVAFDLLIRNTDRSQEKPNIITNGSDLVLLDHELAFGFIRVLPFLRNQQPWLFDEEDKTVLYNHCLYSRVRGQVDRLDDFCDKMISFDSDFWSRVRELVPVEWYSAEEFESIKGHVDSIVEHRKEFIQNLKLLLA